MKNLFQIILIGIAILAVTGCDIKDREKSDTNTSRIQNLLHKEARQLVLSSVNDHSFVILDVRTPEEYNRGHMKNAVLINFYNPGFASEIEKLDPEKSYLVYCQVGGRSFETAKLMARLGFRNIYNLKHGVKRGFPLKPRTSGFQVQPDPTEIKVDLMSGGH